MARPSQPTPTVTDEDVDRVLCRDYPADCLDEIRARIAAVEVREKPRAILACLKIADGNVARLRGALTTVDGYYREIMGEAEYPLATKRWSRIESLPDHEVQAIYDQDWRQYRRWLTRA